jgi:hypothetical protein
MPRFALIFTAFALAACGGSSTQPQSAAENPCGMNPCGDEGEAAPDLSAWSSWTRLNTARFHSKPHGNMHVDVFVEPAFADAYRAGRGEVGMTVVKVQYPSQTAAEPVAITAMRKMGAGYDSGNSDWWYGAYEQDGRSAKMHGKLSACIKCHSGAGGDYLFSEVVLAN